MELLQGNFSEIRAEDLASWLEQKGPSIYWTVDGDPLLAGRLSLPCSGDKLAKVLRKVKKPLLVIAPVRKTCLLSGGAATPNLDDLVEYEELGTRVLQLRWKDSDHTWLLIEDEETSTSESSDSSSSN